MSAYIKNVFRTISNNLRRYLVMVLITALGVAFFVGLRSTSPDMNYTLDCYFDEQGMYDLHFLTSLGITQEQIDSISKISGVKAVLPAHYCDMFITLGSSSHLARLHSLDLDGNGINSPQLLDGRFPLSPDECLAEERFLAITGGKLGDVITVSSGGDEDVLDTLARETYTVVGAVQSPVYISPTLGPSKKGSGSLSAYLYIPSVNFTSEVYTEAYILLDAKASGSRFSEEYENLRDPVAAILEVSGEEIAKTRYDDIQAEGGEKIADGKKEIEDARKELGDAEQELDDAWQKLADGEQELKDKTAEFHEKISDGETKLADGGKKLADARIELNDAHKELEDAKRELEDGKQELEDGKRELEDFKDGMRELAKELDVLRIYEIPDAMEVSLKLLHIGERELKDGKLELEASEKMLKDSRKELEAAEKELNANKGMLEEARAMLAELEAQLDYIRQQMAGIKSQLGGDPSLYPPPYDEVWAELVQNEAMLVAGIEQINSELSAAEAARQQIAEGKLQLDEGEALLNEGKKEWNAGNAKLRRELKSLEELAEELELESIDEIPNGLRKAINKIPNAEKEIKDGEKEIKDGEKKLADAEKTLADAEITLAEKMAEYEDGVRELEDGRAEGLEGIAEGETKLKDARIELEDGQIKYDDAKRDADKKLTDAEHDIADAEEKLRDLDDPKSYVLDLESNIGFASFKQDSDRINSISKYFPLIFFLVAALVAFTSMMRVIEFDRPTIGALKSLGYGLNLILFKYIFYALAVCVPGSLIGVAIGYRLFPSLIFNHGYKIMYLMPSVLTPLYPELGFLAFGIALLSVLIPTFMICARELFDVPAVLLRPKAPPAGKHILLERIPFIWRRMNFSLKVTVRNILRYKKRFFMTVTGVAGCTALVLTGFGLRDSISAIAQNQFGEVFLYDFDVTLKDDPKESDRLELQNLLGSNTDDSVYCYKDAFDAQGTDRTLSVTLTVPEKPEELGRFINLRDPNSRELYPLDDSGVIITQKLAKLLELEAGGDITLTDADDNEFTARISGIVENYVSHYVYMTPELYERTTEQPLIYNQLLCSATGLESVGRDALSAEILKNEAVNGISFLATVRDFYIDMVKSLNTVVLVLLLSGALLSFIVLFSLTSINIDERGRELATLRVLGFYERETADYIFRENIVSTALGTGAGLIAGIALHRLVMGTAEVDAVMFGRQIAPLSFLLTAMLSFVFMAIVNRIMSRSIKKIDMIESLKSVE